MPQPDFIADTTAVVRRLRRDPSVEPFFAGKHFAIAFVTLAELSVGVLKSQNPEAAWRRVLEVIAGAEMFRVSDLTPMIYAGVYHDLEQRGTLIPLTTSGLRLSASRLSCRCSRVTSISTAFPISL